MLHKSIPLAERHASHNYEYANAAARTGATGFVAGDLGKLSWQTDDNTFWILTATTPTWVAFGAGPTLGTNVATFLATPSSANLLAALTNETGTGSAVFAVQPLLLGATDTKTAPAINTGVLTIDMAAGAMFAVSLNAAITSFTMSNVPTTGKLAAFMLEFTCDGTPRAVTWTFSAVAVKWAAATAPTLTSTLNKKDCFVFYTWDGGTSWIGSVVGQNY